MLRLFSSAVARQKGAVLEGLDSLQHGVDAGGQTDDWPAVGKGLAVLVVYQGAAAGRDHATGLARQLLAKAGLGQAEDLFAVVGKDLGNGLAQLGLEATVHIDEPSSQALGQDAPDGGFGRFP